MTTLENELKDLLQKSQHVSAVWLGGSKATKKEDHLSDIDLVIVSDSPKKVFQGLEEFFQGTYSLSHKWELGEVSGKGYEQAFYVLNEFHEYFYLDVVIFNSPKAEILSEYYNEDRHGIPYVLFDKTGILQEAQKLTKKITPQKRDLADELGQLEVMHRTFSKEAKRGNYIDSFTFYHRMVFQLVSFLRREQTPNRFDFGTRYLYKDLKNDDALLIENLLKVSSIEEMQNKALLLKARFTE